MATQVPARNGGTLTRPDKGEVMNPFGRPPMLLSTILKELKEAGYERVGPSNVAEAYELLLGLDKEHLVKATQDEKAPMIVRIVGAAMLSKRGGEMLEKMLDRAHGKAPQRIITNQEDPSELSKDSLTIKYDSKNDLPTS